MLKKLDLEAPKLVSKVVILVKKLSYGDYQMKYWPCSTQVGQERGDVGEYWLSYIALNINEKYWPWSTQVGEGGVWWSYR
jgi:hypothetical protein